jgi:pilus assembly protein CpaC
VPISSLAFKMSSNCVDCKDCPVVGPAFVGRYVDFGGVSGSFILSVQETLAMFFGLDPLPSSSTQKWLAASLVAVASMLSGLSYGQTVAESVPLLKMKPSGDPAEAMSESGPARMQGGLPQELVLPPPSLAARRRASRFVEAEINPELPLALVVGRPKILRLSDTPKRIYVPNEDVIRTDAIDQQSGRELAVTGLRAGTTTLMLWFADKSEPSGESIVSYLVRVYDDPILSRPLDEVQRELNQRFPNSFVQLSDVNGRLMVSGQARDAIEMSQILQVLVGARGVAAGVRRVSPVRTASSLVDFNNNEPLDAEAQEADNRSLVDPVALAQAGIINLMRVPGEQ